MQKKLQEQQQKQQSYQKKVPETKISSSRKKENNKKSSRRIGWQYHNHVLSPSSSLSSSLLSLLMIMSLGSSSTMMLSIMKSSFKRTTSTTQVVKAFNPATPTTSFVVLQRRFKHHNDHLRLQQQHDRVFFTTTEKKVTSSSIKRRRSIITGASSSSFRGGPSSCWMFVGSTMDGAGAGGDYYEEQRRPISSTSRRTSRARGVAMKKKKKTTTEKLQTRRQKTQLSATVEEDLDAALEDILGISSRGAAGRSGGGAAAGSREDVNNKKSSVADTASAANKKTPTKVRLVNRYDDEVSATRRSRPRGSSSRTPAFLDTDDEYYEDDDDDYVNNINEHQEADDGDDEEDDDNDVDDEGPIDYNDPKILSINNPRWMKLGLDSEVIDVLNEKGITTFTPVQGEAYQPIVERCDILGRSRTGTGKTLAFGLPSLQRLVQLTTANGKRNPRNGQMRKGRFVSMLVLCPTRELARQVEEEISNVARPLNLYTTVFHGGVSYEPQSRALRTGCDILVGTPGRIIDHLDRGTLDLSECDIVVLDEADEMLNMGFADDVETILEDVGSSNIDKTQFLLFSATTPTWVKDIARQYQNDDVVVIDSTSDQGGARVATTVRHLAVQLPPGSHTKKQNLEDIIAVEISKDVVLDDDDDNDDDDNNKDQNDVDSIAAAKKKKKDDASRGGQIQQRIFGKTIVFVETKKMADELVSGGVFQSLTAQALHGDVGQKQRDTTLAAFRTGSFNVLVATDVAARGIDIQNVDLVVQFDPPRDADTYVHRSGRTGRAGQKGVSVLLFNTQQARDIVRIERDLGHGFKFDLIGPPSIESALKAAAKTSAVAIRTIPTETVTYFMDSAIGLMNEYNDNPQEVIARCLAAISRRSTMIQSRSLITGEVGYATVEMSRSSGRGKGGGGGGRQQQRGRYNDSVDASEVMVTVGKLSRLSKRRQYDQQKRRRRRAAALKQDDNDIDVDVNEDDDDDIEEVEEEEEDMSFDSDVGKIQTNYESGSAIFDMQVDDAKRLVKFSKWITTTTTSDNEEDYDNNVVDDDEQYYEMGRDLLDGYEFSLLEEMEIERDRYFGSNPRRNNHGRGGGSSRYGGGGGGGRYGGGGNDRYGGGRRSGRVYRSGGGGGGGGGYSDNNYSYGGGRGGRGRVSGGGGGGGYNNNRGGDRYGGGRYYDDGDRYGGGSRGGGGGNNSRGGSSSGNRRRYSSSSSGGGSGYHDNYSQGGGSGSGSGYSGNRGRYSSPGQMDDNDGW